MAKKRVVTQEDYDKANEAYRGDLWNQEAEVAKIATTVGSSDLSGLSEILKKHIDAEWLQSRLPQAHLNWTRKSLMEIAEAARHLAELLSDIDARTADELMQVPGFGPDFLNTEYSPVIQRLMDDADKALEELGDAPNGRPSETLYKLSAVDFAYAYEEFTSKPYTWSGEYAGEETRYPPGRKFVEAGLKAIWPEISPQALGTAGDQASRTLNKNRKK